MFDTLTCAVPFDATKERAKISKLFFPLHNTHDVIKEHACARGTYTNINTQHIENHALTKKVNKSGKEKVD
jgi:hypothetical protein